MAMEVRCDDVQTLMSKGAQLVDVLGAKQYGEVHLAGAINIPLTTLDAVTAAQLDPQRPIIVYCYDTTWDLSARAACRLESLGFTLVLRYTAGKVDWLANGLPTEGTKATGSRVAELVKKDVPTCGLSDRVDEVSARVSAQGWDTCVVVDGKRIVLGLLRGAALANSGATAAEQVMECGPRTYRFNAALDKIADYMRRHDVPGVLLTTTDGRLEGLLKREDVERALAEVSKDT